MSEDVKVQVRSAETRDGLFELAAAIVGGATHLVLTLASLPLVLLPRPARRRVRRAMAEVARAIVVLPKELADVSVRVVDEYYASTANTTTPNFELPKVEDLTEGARRFTDRLARAAEEFGASMRRVSDRAAENVDQAAAKVDEWVEKA